MPCEPATTRRAKLSEQIGQMCGLAAAAIDNATQALLRADLALAERVITDHSQMVEMSVAAERSAVTLLALQQPVAGELRAIFGSSQIVADVDRMGALAVHVAKIARHRHPRHAVPAEVDGCFAEMGRVAVELATRAQEVLRSGDPDKAAGLRGDDDVMDDLYRDLLTVVMDRDWAHGCPQRWTRPSWALLRALRRPRRRNRSAGGLRGDRRAAGRAGSVQRTGMPMAGIAAGHRGVPHTADLRIEAWAPSRDGCIRQAVLGTVDSFLDVSSARPHRLLSRRSTAGSDDDLLVAVLEEVIFLLDTVGEAPVDVDLQGGGGVAEVNSRWSMRARCRRLVLCRRPCRSTTFAFHMTTTAGAAW